MLKIFLPALLVLTAFNDALARDRCHDLQDQMFSYHDDGIEEYNAGVGYLLDVEEAIKKSDKSEYCRWLDKAIDEFNASWVSFDYAIETGQEIAFECSSRLSDYAFSKLEKNIHKNRVNKRKALKKEDKFFERYDSHCQ